MTIQQIRYAITIADAGSINKAAQLLFVSQPSLTTAMQDLERELNISIFNRGGRGVTLTGDGEDFIRHARGVLQQYDALADNYSTASKLKKHFSVSTQHYTFAVKCFAEMVKQFHTDEYDLAIRECRTRDVIGDVISSRSEIGILYLSDFNRKAITKILNENDLQFIKLVDCEACVYLWKEHPLARQKSIRFDQLREYPCLSFEQGADSSYYFSEELMSTEEYARAIKINDRATVLNLMVALNGYTLCSGLICEELNGSEYVAIPLEGDPEIMGGTMEIGYITKKNMILSKRGERYIGEIHKYLVQEHRI
ncbi:MAG: LysR family transcriptional regulator [Lachnospiraceae bacterium]|nr:LysR family transcriptional regulator [Lachnospiraceae bacterium]